MFNEWKETTKKLKEVKSEATAWRIAKTSRREEVIINTLHAGHCAATHGYIMNNELHGMPPICEGCNNAIFTVKHKLLQCPAYRTQRRRMKVFKRLRLVTLKAIRWRLWTRCSFSKGVICTTKYRKSTQKVFRM